MRAFHCNLLGFLSLALLLIPFPGYSFSIAPNGTIVQSSCNGGTLPVCGIPIPMPATTSVDNTAEVHVPSNLLGDASKSLSFTVTCVDNGNGGASYQAVNMQGISCNAFPCQASTVRLCDVSIAVPAGAPLGGLVHLSIPTPNGAQPFTVQCVGKEGGTPIYQISDHSAVSCPGPAR